MLGSRSSQLRKGKSVSPPSPQLILMDCLHSWYQGRCVLLIIKLRLYLRGYPSGVSVMTWMHLGCFVVSRFQSCRFLSVLVL